MAKTAQEDKIFLYVDYENIRRSLLEQYGYIAEPVQVAEALRGAAEKCGKMQKGNVYGDWSIPHPGIDPKKGASAAQRFQYLGFEAIIVPRKPSGQDRTDMKLALDAQKDLLERKADFNAILIAAGDGDYGYLARGIKEAGKRVIVCAVGKTISRELIALADPFLPLENLLKLPVSTPQEKPTPEAEPFDWDPLIRQLDKAERFLENFVAFKHFRDKWLPLPPGSNPDDTDSKHRLLNEAIYLQIIESYKVKNPTNPKFETAAVKLNRAHPIVKKVLG